jgi:TolB-like protein
MKNLTKYIRKSYKSCIFLPLFLLLLCSNWSFSQTKIAVLPFSNLDGNFDLNNWCYELQDSLTKAMKELDPEQKYIQIVSGEEVISALKSNNIEANSPTFDSDKWKIIPALKVDRVISGTFRITAKRFLINSYIYYPETQLSDPDFQAKDIFKKEDKILEAVSVIVKKLSKAFIQKD